MQANGDSETCTLQPSVLVWPSLKVCTHGHVPSTQ